MRLHLTGHCLLAAGLLALIASPAWAQRSTFYDQNGNRTGTAVQSGPTVRFYDKQGTLTGSDTLTSGGQVRRYDAHGNFRGSSVTTPSTAGR